MSEIWFSQFLFWNFDGKFAQLVLKHCMYLVKICYFILCFVTKQFSAKKGNWLLLCGVITTNCRANLYTRQWKTICDEVHIHNGAFHKFFPWGQKSDSNIVRKVRENVLKANFCSVIEWHFEHFTTANDIIERFL